MAKIKKIVTTFVELLRAVDTLDIPGVESYLYRKISGLLIVNFSKPIFKKSSSVKIAACSIKGDSYEDIGLTFFDGRIGGISLLRLQDAGNLVCSFCGASIQDSPANCFCGRETVGTKKETYKKVRDLLKKYMPKEGPGEEIPLAIDILCRRLHI